MGVNDGLGGRAMECRKWSVGGRRFGRAELQAGGEHCDMYLETKNVARAARWENLRENPADRKFFWKFPPASARNQMRGAEREGHRYPKWARFLCEPLTSVVADRLSKQPSGLDGTDWMELIFATGVSLVTERLLRRVDAARRGRPPPVLCGDLPLTTPGVPCGEDCPVAGAVKSRALPRYHHGW